MIRDEWAEQLNRAAQAELMSLVVSGVQVTGSLAGDLGVIAQQDADFLATVGLPQVKGCLYPMIDPAGYWHTGKQVFTLGSYDSAGWYPAMAEMTWTMFETDPATGELVELDGQAEGPFGEHALAVAVGKPEGPRHLFVLEAATGMVVKVSAETEGPLAYRVPVNRSARQFAAMAWRYYHMVPVLREMQAADGEDLVSPQESEAIRRFVWDVAVRVDASVGDAGINSFWHGATIEYL